MQWADTYANPNQEAITVVTKLVDNMFYQFGVLEQLHSDKRAQFEYTLVKDKGSEQYVVNR